MSPSRPTSNLLLVAAAAFSLPSRAAGHGPDQLVPVVFSRTLDVGFGNSVFVVGDVTELGGGVVPLGPKLAWNPELVWRANVALPPLASVTYRFFSRKDNPADVGAETNGTAISDPITTTVPPHPGAVPPPTRLLLYDTTWTAPLLEVEQADGSFTSYPMTRSGPGRSAGEGLWKVSGFEVASRTWRFRLADGAGAQDPGSGGALYEARLQRVLLQDGALYNYHPAPALSGSREETIADVASPQGLLPRTLRIYLPRGYDEQPNRRYPVLYMHDGQNLFGTSGSSFPPVRWNVNGSLDRLIRAGTVRELIVAGVDNTSERLTDYTPPGAPSGGIANGRADRYLSFLQDTVKPLIDSRYRTLPDRANTGIAGSSLGGLVSTYVGIEAPETFSKVGALSPAYWAHRGVMDRINSEPSLPSWRYYLDSGTAGPTAGGSPDGYYDCFDVRDRMLRRGQVLNRHLLHVIGVGHEHNEAAWQQRLPGALRFLFPTEDEPNLLADGSNAGCGDWQLY